MCERWETTERLNVRALNPKRRDIPIAGHYLVQLGLREAVDSSCELYRGTAHVIDAVSGSRVRSIVLCRKPEMWSPRPGRVEERKREIRSASYLCFHSPDARRPHSHLSWWPLVSTAQGYRRRTWVAARV